MHFIFYFKILVSHLQLLMPYISIKITAASSVPKIIQL